MNYVIKLYEKTKNLPLGKRIFSYAIARKSPYFHSIAAQIEHIEHNKIEVSLRKRRKLHNHIKTVHAIAMCNLCEFAGGVLMEASIPKHRRWIPRGMSVKYLKKAETNLIATCDLNGTDWEQCDHVICHVSVKDLNGVKVMVADIDMKVSDKPKKS